jgi:Flp pilus assembly protein CpaB
MPQGMRAVTVKYVEEMGATTIPGRSVDLRVQKNIPEVGLQTLWESTDLWVVDFDCSKEGGPCTLTVAVRQEEADNLIAAAAAGKVKPRFRRQRVLAVPYGMCAVTVPCYVGALAGGFVLPGSAVDLMASKDPDTNLGAETLLENLLVLDVDWNFVFAKDTEFNVAVTVAVPREHVGKLISAIAATPIKNLFLQLRMPTDKEKVH